MAVTKNTVLTVGMLKDILSKQKDSNVIALYDLCTGERKVLTLGDVDEYVEGSLEFNYSSEDEDD